MLLWLLLLLLLLLCPSAAISVRPRLDTRWRFSYPAAVSGTVAAFAHPRPHADGVCRAAATVVDVHFVVYRGLF